MSFTIGANIGPYRIIEQLGRGGMATVYKAYHANLDRYVALKVLHPAFLEDPNFLARFQREAKLVARLEHPNIVPVYDFAEHNDQPYLVMKYVEGETLKAHLNRGRLRVETIWQVVNEAGAGLSYAHQKGILHRDIKPSNVILAEDGQVYLADFGLARIAEMGESTLSGDMIMGTPQYISPEQAKGEKDLDNRTDIYSFAVMLYEMVVGQVPFSADTPFSIIHDHIYSPLPLPKTVNPAIPDEVERVLLKALAKERDDRYQDIPALVDAFTSAWEESDVEMAEVTMTKPITEIAAAVPDPQPATVRQTPAQPAADAATIPPATAEVPPKKKRNVWVWVSAALFLILACFGAFVLLRRVELIRRLAAQTILDEAPLGEEASLPPEDFYQPADLDAQREWAESAPEDPYAHLQFALALFDTKDYPAAEEQLQQALDLAEQDANFYYEAGFNLMDRAIWIKSAQVFLRALQTFPKDTEDYFFFAELFRESLYKAARNPELPKKLPIEEISRIDEPIMRIAEARHTFYHGDPAQAWQMLKEAQELKDSSEARLLEAEMTFEEKRFKDARLLYENLLTDEFVPEWIVDIAKSMLDRMPQN